MTPRSTAEEPGEALPQIAFGGDRRQLEAAVQHAVDDRANHRGAVQRLAGLFPDDADRTVKMDDLPVEQHDRDFGPGVAVKEWASPSRRSWQFSSCGAGALPNHCLNYTDEFLVAQTT